MSVSVSEEKEGGLDDENPKKEARMNMLINLVGVDKKMANDVGTKGLLKLLVASIYKCKDKHYRRKVTKFLEVLKEGKSISALNGLCTAIMDWIKPKEGFITTPKSSKTALEFLKWITLVGQGIDKPPPTFLKLLSVLLHRIHYQRLERTAHQRVNVFLKSLSKDEFKKILSQFMDEKDLVVVCYFLYFLTEEVKKEGGRDARLVWDYDESLRKQVLDIYIKECFMTKVAKEPWFLNKMSSVISPMIDTSDYKIILIPGMQKAMLRSPEIATQAISYCLKWNRICLHNSVMELGKMIGTSLHSGDDTTRGDAVTASINFARQLDIDSIMSLVTWYLDIFNGAEGKLSSTTQKLAILKVTQDLALGVCEDYRCKRDPEIARRIKSKRFFNFKKISQNWTDCETRVQEFVSRIVKILENEVHEGTLIETYKMIFSWMKAWSGDVNHRITHRQCLVPPSKSRLKPKEEEIIPAFPELGAYLTKTLPNLKGSVRTTACRLLLWGSGFFPQLSMDGFVGLLKSILDKSYPHVPQCNAIEECCIVGQTWAQSQPQIFQEKKDIWLNIGSHMNPKYLGSSPLEWIYDACHFIPLCLNYWPDEDVFIEAIANLFTYDLCLKDWRVREEMVDIIRNVYDVPEEKSGKIMAKFMDFIKTFFEKDVIEAKYRKELLTGMAASIVSIFYPHLTTKVEETTPDSALIKDYLSLCCLCPEDYVWLQFARKRHLDPNRILYANPGFLDEVINQFDGSVLKRKMLKTLLHVQPRESSEFKVDDETLRNKFLDTVVNSLFKGTLKHPDSSGIFNITRDEYFIFLTPEDQLYDTSVIEAADDSTKNLKRESRVYSYKEQLEEIQLRKELEEKRKKSGKPIQYTPKQKEAIKNQLGKEKAIRERIANLHKLVLKALGGLESAWEAYQDGCGKRLGDWIPVLIDLMSSPLSAPDAVSFFKKVGKTLFPHPLEGERVVNISLLLLNPKCDLDQNWQKCLQSALQHTLNYLVADIEKVTSCNDSIQLSGPKFSYIFPMLEICTKKYPKDAGIRSSVLKIIGAITQQTKLFDPPTRQSLYDRKGVLQLLTHLYVSYEGGTQQLACSCIYNMTKVASPQEVQETFSIRDEVEVHVQSLMHPTKNVRQVAIQCVNYLAPGARKINENPDTEYPGFVVNVYRSRFDSNFEIANVAKDIWDKNGMQLDISRHGELYELITHPCEEVRQSSARAMTHFLQTYKSESSRTVNLLIESYEKLAIPIPAEVDSLGRVLQEEVDRWEARCGIGLAVKEIAVHMSSEEDAQIVLDWLVNQAFHDSSKAVTTIMLEAAIEVSNVHGPACLNEFIAIIETFLEKAGDSGKFDNVRQACVILMGSLAKHLHPSDERVKSIFTTLVDTLSTPSEKVQEAVANCLPALVPSVGSSEGEVVLKRLLSKVMDAETYGERRGAAYGVAGVIKGLGILSLKQHDVMNILAQNMQDKKNYKHREGALMCLELLCDFLGRLFEPYIVHVLPYLLQCLGDSNVYVREATENTAKRVMSKLSAHGVKLVLPTLIVALNEDSWRTKCGSVELLGRMAYCAPKQLSGCLPMIVPKLIEVLGDSHVKVQEAAAKALGVIGSVIQNPEIQSVVPILLEALQDPGKRSTSCLVSLLETEFVHFVDPPSLALIMPVVQRAFQDRSTENRKMASQVIGNMYSLTDHTDLAPYMNDVMPGIRASLVDPVPEVRSVAGKALGSMAKGMGDKCYDELLPWLMRTLVSETNAVDRSGAAQGLAEVIRALGEDKLHKFMPEIIKKADTDDLAPHVRDGYMMMFIYMPGVFETEFVPYIGQIINPILKALADENEYVRETALRAGQRIVTGFAETAITLLLPELERGIFDDNWRIRFSSIQLLGDLLYKISGVSGKMSTESAGDDDNFGTEQSQQAIIQVLGLERRNRVLSGLYMGRSDVALMVRQAALHVWKVVVANTPKTLREILPTLFSLLLGCLASPSHDKRQVAARTLGDLVRKLGEKILPEIIPILELGLDSTRADERQGVCIGLSEIMASTSREMVLAFVDNLVPTLRKALCDPEPQVREAAAKTFASLHSTVGNKALDEILPFLMKKLSDPEEGENALDGLGQILVVKSKAVLPYLIPQLTSPPINTKALSILASVAGDSLSRHLGKIIPALITVLSESAGTPAEKDELEYCQRIILTIVDDQGVRILLDDLLEYLRNEKQGMKRATVSLLSLFCIHTRADIEPYMSHLIRGLFLLMTNEDEVILNSVADGLTAIIKNLDNAERMSYVGDVRQALRFVQGDLKGKSLLPGLCTSKGINPVLPIFREALLNGGADIKEQAAIGMGELIALSNESALKPSVIHITGPLIRILGDRYGPTVKIAVMDTLTVLLSKVGIHLKAFLPQLQTTFLKAAGDTNRNVRLKAAVALAQLMPFHTKPDPMFVDLVNNIKQADDVLVRDTLLYTLRCTLLPAGDKMTESTRKIVMSLVNQILLAGEDPGSIVGAGALGILIATSLNGPELEAAISLILDENDSDPFIKQAKSTAVCVALQTDCKSLYNATYKERVLKYVQALFASDKYSIVGNGLRACVHIFAHCFRNKEAYPAQLVAPFIKSLNNPNNEVKILMGHACEVLARSLQPNVIPTEFLKTLIPSLVMGTKEKNSIVRASCESGLVYLLHLRQGEQLLNTILQSLELGAKESLNDVVSRNLRKCMQLLETKEPEIDDSILS